MSRKLPVHKRESILDDFRELERRIMNRAYDIFHGNGGVLGRELDHWLQAESELVWKPSIEMSEKEGRFDLKIAVPGIDPKDVDLEVTKDHLLVKASMREETEEKGEKGTVYAKEIRTGNMFRAVHLPKPIDPDSVTAKFKNGMLYVTAKVAKEETAKSIKVDA